MLEPTAPLPRPAGNIAEHLWRMAATRPAGEAILHRERSVAYGALRDRAAAIGAALMNEGPVAGERIAVFVERSIDAAACFFGVVAAGGVAVMVNERLRPRQIEYMLRHSGARTLLTTRDLAGRQPRAIDTAASIRYVEDLAAEAAALPAPVARMRGDLAEIIYTSGSTGLPKGVTCTHGTVQAGLETCVAYLGTRASDRVAALLPFSSVYGQNQLLSSVAVGATLLIETSPVPQQIAERLRDAGVTVMAAVPPLWLQLLSAPAFRDERIATLRQLQNAGGHLPVHAARQLRAAQPHARLFLQYGMTETFRGTYLPPELVDAHPGSMGRAVPFAELMVLREDGTPCDVGEVGELVHRGPSVSPGYWNDPDATARVFRPNPARRAGDDPGERVVFSGDMVRRDENGLLHFVSRRDRLIKTLGFRVGPDEVADVLYASGQVDECLVTSLPDAQRGDAVVAFVVLAPGGSLATLTQFARVELPRHMQPSRIEALEAIPRLASGKYDVAAVKARFGTENVCVGDAV